MYSRHHVVAGNVLEHGVGVDEVETTHRRNDSGWRHGGVKMSVWNIRQTLARQPNHFIRHVDAVDFSKMPAKRLDQTAGAAADFKRAPRPAIGVRLEGA